MKKESKLNLNAGDYAISHCDSDKTYNGLEVRKMLCDAYISGSDDTLEDDDEKVKNKLIILIKMSNEAGGFALHKWEADEMLAWLEKQKDCIKLSDSAYTSNRDVIEFADKYSYTVWEKLMDKFKKNENYSIGCNDVSDIVLNAIINTYNWLEKQGQVKESTISQHENRTCEENGNSLTSEDERIRKEIINYFQCQSEEEPTRKEIHDKWIAWLENIPYTIDNEKREGFHLGYKACLERQVEQNFEMKTAAESLGISSDEYNKIVDECLFGEQKPTDKVEPHFRVEKGKWYVCIKNNIGITKGNAYYGISDGYIIDDNGRKYNCNNWAVFQRYLRLWNISDARDGDVLAVDSMPFIYNGSKNEVTVGAYCGFNTKHRFSFAHNYVINQNITPATKEQHDFLFQKMNEAGYTFDFEDKKLKKFEPKTKENKGNIGGISANWSEEDKYMYDILCGTIENTDINENTKYKLISWLKSLRPQNRWKPSSEQMTALRRMKAAIAGEGEIYKPLNSLYEDLKKLKEE